MLESYNDIINNPHWPPMIDKMICAMHPEYNIEFIGIISYVKDDHAIVTLLNNRRYMCKKLRKRGQFILKPSYYWEYVDEYLVKKRGYVYNSTRNIDNITKHVHQQYHKFIRSLKKIPMIRYTLKN